MASTLAFIVVILLLPQIKPSFEIKVHCRVDSSQLNAPQLALLKQDEEH